MKKRLTILQLRFALGKVAVFVVTALLCTSLARADSQEGVPTPEIVFAEPGQTGYGMTEKEFNTAVAAVRRGDPLTVYRMRDSYIASCRGKLQSLAAEWGERADRRLYAQNQDIWPRMEFNEKMTVLYGNSQPVIEDEFQDQFRLCQKASAFKEVIRRYPERFPGINLNTLDQEFDEPSRAAAREFTGWLEHPGSVSRPGLARKSAAKTGGIGGGAAGGGIGKVTPLSNAVLCQATDDPKLVEGIGCAIAGLNQQMGAAIPSGWTASADTNVVAQMLQSTATLNAKENYKRATGRELECGDVEVSCSNLSALVAPKSHESGQTRHDAHPAWQDNATETRKRIDVAREILSLQKQLAQVEAKLKPLNQEMFRRSGARMASTEAVAKQAQARYEAIAEEVRLGRAAKEGLERNLKDALGHYPELAMDVQADPKRSGEQAVLHGKYEGLERLAAMSAPQSDEDLQKLKASNPGDLLGTQVQVRRRACDFVGKLCKFEPDQLMCNANLVNDASARMFALSKKASYVERDHAEVFQRFSGCLQSYCNGVKLDKEALDRAFSAAQFIGCGGLGVASFGGAAAACGFLSTVVKGAYEIHEKDKTLDQLTSCYLGSGGTAGCKLDELQRARVELENMVMEVLPDGVMNAVDPELMGVLGRILKRTSSIGLVKKLLETVKRYRSGEKAVLGAEQAVKLKTELKQIEHELVDAAHAAPPGADPAIAATAHVESATPGGTNPSAVAAATPPQTPPHVESPVQGTAPVHTEPPRLSSPPDQPPHSSRAPTSAPGDLPPGPPSVKPPGAPHGEPVHVAADAPAVAHATQPPPARGPPPADVPHERNPDAFGSFKDPRNVPHTYRNPKDPEGLRRFDQLASDPAHGGKISEGSRREAMAGLEAERQGIISGPITRGPAEIEFYDSHGVAWDAKTPRSPPSGVSWAFNPEEAAASLEHQLRDQGKPKTFANPKTGHESPIQILLDTTYLSEADEHALWARLHSSLTPEELARVHPVKVRLTPSHPGAPHVAAAAPLHTEGAVHGAASVGTQDPGKYVGVADREHPPLHYEANKFDHTVTPAPHSLAATHPDLYREIVALDVQFDADRVVQIAREKYHLGSDATPTMDQVLETAREMKTTTGRRVLDRAATLPEGTPSRHALENLGHGLLDSKYDNALDKLAAKHRGEPFDPKNREHFNAAAIVTSGTRGIVGEGRVAMMVPGLEASSLTTTDVFNRIQANVVNGKDKKQRLVAIMRARETLPSKLRTKELDLFFIDGAGNPAIGEVKNFKLPLDVGDMNWPHVSDQAGKSTEIINALSKAGAGTFSKHIYLIQGCTQAAAVELRALGYVVHGPIFP